MIEIPVSVGCGRREMDVRAGYSVAPTEIVAEEGLMGVAGREWFMYHANTDILLAILLVDRGEGKES